MEKPELNQNITVVHKGFFYLIFKLIAFPFKIIFWIMKFGWKYISIYLGWLKEYYIQRKKTKSLNKMLFRKRIDEEII